VLDFDAVMLAQVELGLGPLHTQYDDQGNAYTSLFLDSAVAKWSLGGDDPAGYKLLEKLPVQYNIGHISAAEGDTSTRTASTWWRSTSGRWIASYPSARSSRRTSSCSTSAATR
jgi:nitrous oxide reductase